MAGWSHRPLFKSPTNMMGGGPVGMPKGISGYVTGGEVNGESKSYEQTIAETAKLFSSSDPNRPRLLRDYESNLHWYAKNIAGGHQVPEEQVMQDLEKAIETQRGAMPAKKGIIERLQEKMGGSTQKLNQLGSPEDINFSPTGMMHGGIARLVTGGLFEGEEIVEINPMLNQIAGQGGSGIASVSTEPAPGAAPERNVPNERGIIELAMDAEEVEDDEPIIAFAKQEAKSKLDEEFNILKSTAQAEAAQGEDPSFIIKRSMDSLARSANVIEQDIIEQYPEVPMDANLISSEDLEPYQQELVAVFETPEVGSEEPLMDTAILAKRGGLIPGYQDGGVAEVPPGWEWIDEEFIGKGLTLEQAEEEMYKKYGSAIGEVREKYGSPETELEQRKRRSGMTSKEVLAEVAKEKADPRKADLIRAIKGTDFMKDTGAPVPPVGAGMFGMPDMSRLLPEIERGGIKKYKDILKAYKELDTPLPTVTEEIPPSPGEAQYSQEEIAAAVADFKKAMETGTQASEESKTILRAALTTPKSTTPEGGPPTTPEGRKAPITPTASTQSSSIQAALDAITDLQKGFEGRAATLETGIKKGAKELTNVYDTEIEKSNTAIIDANTAIGKTLVAYEKNIPELARLMGLRSPGTAIFQKQNAAREAEIRMENNAQNVRLELAGLDKKAAEARRTNDVKALRDVKLAQLNAINSLKEMSLGKGLDMQLDVLVSTLEHEMRLDEIRQEAALQKNSGGVNAEMADRVNLLKARIANETDPDKKTRLEEELSTYETILLGQSSPKAMIEKALADGDYNNLFMIKSVEEITRHASALKGTKTITLKGIPAPIVGKFSALYDFLIQRSPKDEKRKYTPKEIVQIWLRSGD